MIQYLTTLIAFLALLPLMGSIVQWMAFRVVNVNVKRFKIYYGAPIARFRIFGTSLAIGYLPFGSSIVYDIPSFRSKPVYLRVLIILLGPLTLLAFALFVLGFDLAFHHFRTGMIQLLTGALSPLNGAPGFIEKLHEVYHLSGLDMAGIVSAKISSYSCLPIGGMATAEIIRQLSGQHAAREGMERYLIFNALIAILIAATWAIAIVSYAASRLSSPT